jgi:hypothetical protein
MLFILVHALNNFLALGLSLQQFLEKQKHEASQPQTIASNHQTKTLTIEFVIKETDPLPFFVTPYK